jgi:3-oxoadipate enol-lactonase
MKIRGINIVYDDLGKGDVIVFIHGQPFNRSMWKYQADVFKKDYRLIIPDLRGYGQSDIPEKSTLLDELAMDIIHLLEELKIQKAIFAGLSMGGQIVFELYRLVPHIFSGMVLCDTDARPESEQGYIDRLKLSQRILDQGMKKYTHDSIQHYLHKNTFAEKKEVVVHLTKMMETTSAVGAAAVQRGRAERRDHLPVLSNITCPVLIIVGKDDEFTPVPLAVAMHKLIKHSTLAIIEDASHMPNMEQPEKFNQQLQHFLLSIR